MNLKFSKAFIGLGIAFIPSASIYAQDTLNSQATSGKDGRVNSITTAVPFLLIAPDSRAGGMGDAGVASSPDVNSIHWNPAKLAFATKKYGLGISYTPWLQALVPDISLSYLSGYVKLDDRQTIAGSLLYFSLGNIVFTDITGEKTGDFNPHELAVDGAYSRKLSENLSIGTALRFIYSNLASGQTVSGQEIRPGVSVATDISAYYQRDVDIGKYDTRFAFGGNISNIGSKISYTDAAERDFIPTNLRIGGSGKIKLDDYNEISLIVDINKLLVPTQPIYERDTATGELRIIKGKDPERSVPAGIFGSFSDAPEGFKEELNEIYYSTGLEYWYDQQFALRAGYFYEHPLKGNRQFFTLGAGLKYNIFGLDFAYLIPTEQRNPLENTLRFSLTFDFRDSKKENK